MLRARHKLTLFILLILISLFFGACTASDKLTCLIGDWESLSETHILGESGDDIPKMSSIRTEVSFYKDGTGLWCTSFDENYPSVSKGFIYVVGDGTITLNYDDGETETFFVSLSNGILELDGKKTQWTLSRVV